MDAVDRRLTPRARGALVAIPFVLAAVLVLVFDVAREIPHTYGCDPEPDGHDAAVAAYRSGATLPHLLAIGWALGTLALLSAGRGPLGIGWPTFVAAAATVAAALTALLAPEGVGIFVLLPLLLVDIAIVVLADPLGARATGALAMLMLLAGAWRFGNVVAAGRTGGARLALWALVVLTGAHLLLVGLQGEGITFC